LAISAACMANAFAAEFVDMPDNWTTEALNNAVKNGLLYGEETADGSGMKINPDDNITRAQMAAIIVRAFGASETTDISAYTDVDQNAWYYTELSKAVAMNAFRGDGNLMNPQNNITFQECFTVLSQVLRLDIYNKEETCLDVFADKADIAQWAIPYATAIVGNGFWEGIDGKLLPTTYITRSQFAVLMDNIVKTYIDEPGEYSEFEEGNVMVRTDGVIIKDATLSGDLIIGDGVLEGFDITNTKIANNMYIRGGADQVKISDGTTMNKCLLINPDIEIHIDATSSYDRCYTCHKTNIVNLSVILGDEAITDIEDTLGGEEKTEEKTEVTDENAEKAETDETVEEETTDEK